MRNPIIAALDVPTAEQALKLAADIAPAVGAFKIGSELFTAAGPDIVHRVRATGASVFLDLKFHDIPNTVSKAVTSAVRLDVQMLTAHTSGGLDMLKAAEQAATAAAQAAGYARPLVLGVTVLTSLNAEALRAVGLNAGVEDQVRRLAEVAIQAGLRGLVCSPQEVVRLRQFGSTGPGSVHPETGKIYGPDFPLVGVRDNVRAQARLLDSLGIRKLRLALGGSIGGMQALEWTILHPERVERALVIGVTPLSAMGLALNHLQRQAIQHDPEWAGGRYLPQRPPRRGLSLARQIAMISYKSAPLFDERYGRNPDRSGEDPYLADGACGGLIGGRFDIGGYLDHQGRRFIERFDANAYLAILRAMDTWDPVRGYESPEAAFGRIRARLSFIGISTDWLFPAEDVRRFAESIRQAGAQADYRAMESAHGHDAFLAEQSELVRLLQ